MILENSGMCVIFFCKHKTAYEMRISEWSSDVCSSDLTLPNIASKRNMICSVPLCNVSRMDSNELDSPGKRLKWAREKAGFQQAGDFAKRVGVHPTTYRAYENDQNGFAKKVHEFAERLGVTGAWLMRGGDIEPRPVEDMPLDHQARQLGLMLVGRAHV